VWSIVLAHNVYLYRIGACWDGRCEYLRFILVLLSGHRRSRREMSSLVDSCQGGDDEDICF
jgi:hypothetical protein